jgi:hypothetical protein
MHRPHRQRRRRRHPYRLQHSPLLFYMIFVGACCSSVFEYMLRTRIGMQAAQKVTVHLRTELSKRQGDADLKWVLYMTAYPQQLPLGQFPPASRTPLSRSSFTSLLAHGVPRIRARWWNLVSLLDSRLVRRPRKVRTSHEPDVRFRDHI